MIHVVTPCTRPVNLPAILESLRERMPVPWEWWIILDRAHVKAGVSVPGAHVLELPSCGIFGRTASNHVLELISDGWCYFLDDDTIIHPEFSSAFTLARLEHPEALGFVFHVVRADGTLYVSPNGPTDTVDTAAFIFHREAIGSVRWEETKPCADQKFHRAVERRNPGKIVYVPKVAAIYNALR